MERAWTQWIAPLLAVAMAAYALTHWVVMLALPAPAPLRTAPPELSALNEVFANPAPRAAAPALAQAPLNVQLLGTVLPTTSAPARALLRVDGKVMSVREGEAVLNSGLVVARVAAREVALRGANAEMTTIAIQGSAAARAATPNVAPPTAPAAAASTRLSVASGCPANAAQKQNGVVLATEMLVGALQNTSAISAMLVARDGKLVVQNTAGIGALLNLRDGDVLRAADARRLSSASDVAQHVLTPLTQARMVSLEYDRAGLAQMQLYLPPGCKS